MTKKISILISSHNRLSLFKRTLYSIANAAFPAPFEVVVADDGSTEDILGELQRYSSAFPWTFIRLDTAKFEQETGVKKYFNNPAWSNNAAFAHCRGDLLFLQGNEVIAYHNAYQRMLAERPDQEHFLVFSTTLDVPREVLDVLDDYGSNLSSRHIQYCQQWPLATPSFHTDVTNYLSLTSRSTWEAVGGYDERYVGGLGKEDSDFVRRCRALPGWTDERNMRRTTALSLHQSHGGRTWFSMPDPAVITQERWAQGEALSKEVWDTWTGDPRNAQPWPAGKVGVVEVIRNGDF